MSFKKIINAGGPGSRVGPLAGPRSFGLVNMNVTTSGERYIVHAKIKTNLFLSPRLN